MNYYASYINDHDPLYTLSRRIGNSTSPMDIAKQKRAHHQEVLANALKYNLVKLLADMMYAARWEEPTPANLEAVLDEYNAANGTPFSVSDFRSKGWVREVNGKILFPSVVGSILSSITRHQKDSTRKEEMPGKEDPVWALKMLYDLFPSERRAPLITKDELTLLLRKHGNANVTTSFLEAQQIIVAEGINYRLTVRNVYQECFFSELAFLLWERFGEGARADDFRKFLSILHKFDLFDFHDLWTFLEAKSLERLRTLAIAFLNSEPDLDGPADEMKKIFLDQNHFHHVPLIIPEPPSASFDAKDPYLLLVQKERLDAYHHDLFDYQRVRTIYRLAMRLVIQLQTNYKKPYADVLQLMKQCDKPFLVYELQYEIQRNYPYIIPYLLNDDALAPVGMNMLDKLKHSHQWLGTGLNIREVASLRADEIESFWQEGFAHLLDRYSRRLSLDSETAAHVLGRILLDQASRVFTSYNKRIDYNRLEHLAQKKRYNLMLEQLRSRMLDSNGYHTSSGYVPMLLDSLLPSLLTVLMEPPIPVQENEFLKFKAVFIFLYADLLRFTENIDTTSEERTFTPAQIAEVEKQAYTFLSEELIRYFTQKTVTVSVYFGPEKDIPVKRGINDFGLELIQWGELLLHFQRWGLLAKMEKNFKKTLKFNKQIRTYNEGNNSEMVKLDYYLRILLHGCIAIHKNANRYRYAKLPVNETIDWLEERITHYAITYHSTDRTRWSPDLFNDRFIHITPNFYRKPLFELLCRAVSYFDPQKLLYFLESFFNGSTDLLQMLTAYNKIDSPAVHKWLEQKVAAIDIDTFMKDSWSITEIEQALLEAINSVEFFDFAEPLLARVEQHAQKVRQFGLANNNFIFRLRAYQAFRKKDMEMLDAVPESGNSYADVETRMSEKNVKKYYRALHDLYHLGNYAGAIEVLGSLSSQFPKNADYAFHLYRARIFKATANESDRD